MSPSRFPRVSEARGLHLPAGIHPGLHAGGLRLPRQRRRLTAAGYKVLALSADSVDKLAKFKTEYELLGGRFLATSDPGPRGADSPRRLRREEQLRPHRRGRDPLHLPQANEDGKVIEALYNAGRHRPR